MLWLLQKSENEQVTHGFRSAFARKKGTTIVISITTSA
jgi:hypothetical protein